MVIIRPPGILLLGYMLAPIGEFEVLHANSVGGQVQEEADFSPLVGDFLHFGSLEL